MPSLSAIVVRRFVPHILRRLTRFQPLDNLRSIRSHSHPTPAMSVSAPSSATNGSSSSSTRVGLIGSAAADSLTPLDWRLVAWQHQLKNDLPERPKQTGFRVFCILTYQPEEPKSIESTVQPPIGPHPFDQHNYIDGTDKQLAYVTGTNTEPCFIGSGICSERSAILQMRMKHYKTIEKLYITADSDAIITPGLLCREMLCEFLTLDTPIILASKNPQLPNGFDVQVASLRTLYPYPSIYLNVPGSTVGAYAKQFHSSAEKLVIGDRTEKKEWIQLYEQVKAATEKDLRPSLHPLRYAAGVLFSDGTTRCVGMTKLLEYGWSLDPAVKLVPYLEEKKEAGIRPTLLLICDQYGNLHSPTAPGRSHLGEYGYDPVLIFHDRTGKLIQTSVRELSPDVPDAIEDVLPSTVTQSAASSHEDCAHNHTK